MKAPTLSLIGLLLILCPFAFSTTARSQSAKSWFEQKPLRNWNKPGSAVPKAPNNTSRTNAQCQHQIRNAATPQERAVQSAGWTLYNGRGEGKNSRGVSLIKGLTDFDGMCRALGYQEFVFVNGVFAGTTSPNLMNARSDGGLIETNIETPSRLKAQFSRYVKQDPSCCASQISEVTYRIDVANKKPFVVPIQVRTYANPR